MIARERCRPEHHLQRRRQIEGERTVQEDSRGYINDNSENDYKGTGESLRSGEHRGEGSVGLKEIVERITKLESCDGNIT